MHIYALPPFLEKLDTQQSSSSQQSFPRFLKNSQVSPVDEQAANVSQWLNTSGCEFCISPCGQHTGTQGQRGRGGSNTLIFRIVMKMFQANLENIRNPKGINPI